jgi:tetratricopeptide (TPR) repeat protein
VARGEGAAGGRRLKRAAAIALGLVALVVAVFAQARHHEFVNLDDGIYVVRNPALDAGLGREVLVAYFTTPILGHWIPLTRLSYHVDHALFGKQARGYILGNLALHLLATILLFAALARMTRQTWPSAFVAAVFAVHPLHVEAVVWVSERKGVLAGFFWMAGLVAYLRYVERPSRGRYGAVLACLAAGLLSKAVLVTFPFALLLLDHWPLRRLSRHALLEKLPMLALVAGASALALWSQRAGGAMEFAQTYELSLDLRLRNAVHSVVWYLEKSFWPTGLTAYYPHPLGSLSETRALFEAGCLLALSALALGVGRRLPPLAVGWLWFLGTLLPTLGLVQAGSQARADRYSYVPQVGLAIALAYSAAQLAAGRPRALRALGALAGVCVAALGGAAWLQVRSWRSSESLYERNLAVEPGSAFGHHGLGLVRIGQDRLDEAERHLRETYRLRPELGRRPLRRLELLVGSRAAARGDAAAAIERYESAVALDPEDADANGILGAALVRAGEGARALPHLERSVASGAAPAVAHAALAVVLAGSGRAADAVREGRLALRKDPDLAFAANNLAWILATSPDPGLRDPAEALRLAESAARSADAPDPDLLDTLAAAQAAAGRFDAAVATAELAAARADAAGRSALAREIRARLALYRAGRPYVDPAPPGAS